MQPLFSTPEFARRLYAAVKRALRPITGAGWITVVDGPNGVNIVGMPIYPQTVGGGGSSSQPRAAVTGRTSDDMRFLAKLLDSKGQPLKDEDGADLPAIEIWADTWPPGTPIGDCLQQYEIGHEIPIRYHIRYDFAEEVDVRRPYIDTILIAGCTE